MELSKILDSQVSSGLTDKIYRTNINEIQTEDDKQTSELYEVNIFGNVVQIAPGLTIKDTQYPKLIYCYVYAIVKNKVKAKLGIVEDLTTTPPVFFDISLIEDGRLRLFDVYEQNPELIKDLEYVPNTTEKVKDKQLESGYIEMNENVFDYFIREIKDGITTSEQYKEISEELKDENKRKKDTKTNDEIRKALDTYKKAISDEKTRTNKKVYYFNKNVINDIRKYVTNINKLSEILFILHIVLKNFNFIVIDDNEIVHDINKYRLFNRTPENNSLPYIVVQWKDDMPMLIGKYDSYKILPQKYTGVMIEPIKRPRTIKNSESVEAKPSRKTTSMKESESSTAAEPLPPPKEVKPSRKTTSMKETESAAAAPPLPPPKEVKPSRKTTSMKETESAAAAPPLPPPKEVEVKPVRTSALSSAKPLTSLKELEQKLRDDNNDDDEYSRKPKTKTSLKSDSQPKQVVQEVESLLNSNENEPKKIPNPKSTQRLKKGLK
jgi:hypothetical protein